MTVTGAEEVTMTLGSTATTTTTMRHGPNQRRARTENEGTDTTDLITVKIIDRRKLMGIGEARIHPMLVVVMVSLNMTQDGRRLRVPRERGAARNP